MTDTQILTIAIAVIVPLSVLLDSNSRVSDVGKRIDDTKETLRAEMRAEMTELRSHIDADFERIEHALKLRELKHHK